MKIYKELSHGQQQQAVQTLYEDFVGLLCEGRLEYIGEFAGMESQVLAAREQCLRRGSPWLLADYIAAAVGANTLRAIATRFAEKTFYLEPDEIAMMIPKTGEWLPPPAPRQPNQVPEETLFLDLVSPVSAPARRYNVSDFTGALDLDEERAAVALLSHIIAKKDERYDAKIQFRIGLGTYLAYVNLNPEESYEVTDSHGYINSSEMLPGSSYSFYALQDFFFALVAVMYGLDPTERGSHTDAQSSNPPH